jgi:hypothetical protein
MRAPTAAAFGTFLACLLMPAFFYLGVAALICWNVVRLGGATDVSPGLSAADSRTDAVM